MTNSDLAGIAPTCPLFRGLTDTDVAELVELFEIETYAAGQSIVVEGTSHAALWVVVSGECAVIKCGKDERQLALLGVGEIFGEMSFFHPAPGSATVRAMVPVMAARLASEKFDRLVRSGHRIAYRLAVNTIGVLSERLRRMDDLACKFLEKPPQQREEWAEFHSKLHSGWKF